MHPIPNTETSETPSYGFPVRSFSHGSLYRGPRDRCKKFVKSPLGAPSISAQRGPCKAPQIRPN